MMVALSLLGEALMRSTARRTAVVFLACLALMVLFTVPGCWVDCSTGELDYGPGTGPTRTVEPDKGASGITAKVEPSKGTSSAATTSETSSMPGTWLLSSEIEAGDWHADWHIILAGTLEAGSISIPEEKTAKGIYKASGDKLTIDFTRFEVDPQKFHYDFTGYPGDTMQGTILVGALNPSEPEWRSPMPARATR
jgi:hypothetical protein